MKVTIESEDAYQIRRMLGANEAFGALFEIQNQLRSWRKHGFGKKTVAAVLAELNELVPHRLLESLEEPF